MRMQSEVVQCDLGQFASHARHLQGILGVSRAGIYIYVCGYTRRSVLEELRAGRAQ